jgi:murein DD-endopeptidase MepM/ murein hydrolase activator NlpD
MRKIALIAAGLLGLGAAVAVVTNEGPIEDPVWWYSNTTPPRLSVEGPKGPLRGPVEGAIQLEPADRAHIVSVSVDGRAMNVGPNAKNVDVDSASLPDGQHQLLVVARDTSRLQNQTVATWSFVSDNTPPKLDLSLDPAEGPREGHTWLLRIKADKPDTQVKGSLGNQPLELQPDGAGGYWALEGVPPDPPYTSVSVELTAADALGNSGKTDQTWPVQHTTFPEDDVLGLDPVPADARAQEDAQLQAIYAQDDGPKRWEGAFRMPVQGPVTTDFGTHRPYEYHPGTDFGVGLNTPVAAPARGVVVFEGEEPARGNVLVLAHGAGVYSTYAHLNRFEVQPGQDVAAGQTIARVGSTGFSTGPHLHWELWVAGSNVDPIDWTRRAYP